MFCVYILKKGLYPGTKYLVLHAFRMMIYTKICFLIGVVIALGIDNIIICFNKHSY
jgi:hypothetical protein